MGNVSLFSLNIEIIGKINIFMVREREKFISFFFCGRFSFRILRQVMFHPVEKQNAVELYGKALESNNTGSEVCCLLAF